jgi:hypothetical protein
MPITHAIDHAHRRMDTRATGTVTYPEVVAHLAAERDAGGLPYRELIDLTHGELAFSAAEIRRLVEDLRRLGRGRSLGPTAVVVGSEFTYGMLRMLEALVEDVCLVRPFRDRGEAEGWLAAVPEEDAALEG